MTDVEIIQKSITTLGSINVPVDYVETIGVPIFVVKRYLQMILDSINQKKEQPAPQEPAEPTQEESTEQPSN